MKYRKIGLIVNPYAGLGAEHAIKGSDNPEAVSRLLNSGAKLTAPEKAVEALKQMMVFCRSEFELLAGAGMMGEAEARSAGIKHMRTVGRTASPATTAYDTKVCAEKMLKEGAELIAGAGGDGTFRDIYSAVGDRIPIVMVPAGTKMYSDFPLSPRDAGDLLRIAVDFGLETTDAVLQDVDEAPYQKGRIEFVFSGVAKTLRGEREIASKDFAYESGSSMHALAKRIAEDVLPSYDVYIKGPGSHNEAVAQLLGLDYTKFGFDIYRKGQLLVKDAKAADLILYTRGEKCVCTLSPFARSGLLLGKGNLQLTPDAIRQIGRENIIAISTQQKLNSLSYIYIHTGDYELNSAFRGETEVITETGRKSMPVKVGGDLTRDYNAPIIS